MSARNETQNLVPNKPPDLRSHYVELDDESASSVQSLEDVQPCSQQVTWDRSEESGFEKQDAREDPQEKPEPHFQFKGIPEDDPPKRAASIRLDHNRLKSPVKPQQPIAIQEPIKIQQKQPPKKKESTKKQRSELVAANVEVVNWVAKGLHAELESERCRMRSEAGLGKFNACTILGKCAMRRGGCADVSCLVDSEKFIVTSEHRRYVLNCSDGCLILYHFQCWQYMKKENILPSLKVALPTQRQSKQGLAVVPCPTDGCRGQVMRVLSYTEVANGVPVPRLEYEAPDAPKKAKKHKRTTTRTKGKNTKQHARHEDAHCEKPVKNTPICIVKKLEKKEHKQGSEKNKTETPKDQGHISDKVLHALSNIKLIEHRKTKDLNEATVGKQKPKVQKQAKKKPMHLCEFRSEAIRFNEPRKLARRPDQESEDSSSEESIQEKALEPEPEEIASEASTASLYDFGPCRHDKTPGQDSMSAQHITSALAFLRREFSGSWNDEWQSILVEGLNAATEKEVMVALSAIWDCKDAVEWRAFPALQSCAIRFHTSSQALSAARGFAGEAPGENQIRVDALREFPTHEVLLKVLEGSLYSQEILDFDAEATVTKSSTQIQEDDHSLWLSLCKSSPDALDGGESKLLALLQNESIPRSSPKLDVWLSGQLCETERNQAFKEDPSKNLQCHADGYCPLAKPHSQSLKESPTGIEAIARVSSYSMGLDVQQPPPSSQSPCPPMQFDKIDQAEGKWPNKKPDTGTISSPQSNGSVANSKSGHCGAILALSSGLHNRVGFALSLQTGQGNMKEKTDQFQTGAPPDVHHTAVFEKHRVDELVAAPTSHNQSGINSGNSTNQISKLLPYFHSLQYPGKSTSAVATNRAVDLIEQAGSRSVDERQWATCVDVVYVFPCHYEYLEQCQQAGGRLALEKKWFKDGLVTNLTALFFCNIDYPEDMSLEGIWKPVDCSSDPIAWDWVLRDAPLSFKKTPGLQEIYSPDNKNALVMLCRQGICLYNSKAQALIGLFLGNIDGSTGTSCGLSDVDQPPMGPRQNIGFSKGLGLSCKQVNQNLHDQTANENMGQQKVMVPEASHHQSEVTVNRGPGQSNPLDRLFPFMRQSQGCDLVAKESNQPKPGGRKDSCTVPTNPPGITLPKKKLNSLEHDTEQLICASKMSSEARHASIYDEKKVFANSNHKQPARKAGTSKMAVPPGFHQIYAPRQEIDRYACGSARSSGSQSTNPKDANMSARTSGSQSTNPKDANMSAIEKYIPPHKFSSTFRN